MPNVQVKNAVAAVVLNRYARVERIDAGPDVTTVGTPLIDDQCDDVPAGGAVPVAAIPHSAPHRNLTSVVGIYAPRTLVASFWYMSVPTTATPHSPQVT